MANSNQSLEAESMASIKRPVLGALHGNSFTCCNACMKVLIGRTVACLASATLDGGRNVHTVTE